MRVATLAMTLALAGFGCSAETCGHSKRAAESAGRDLERGTEELKDRSAEGLQRTGEKIKETGDKWEADRKVEVAPPPPSGDVSQR